MDAIQAAVKGRRDRDRRGCRPRRRGDGRGRKIGAIGDLTCFSLYATKSLAGGEGGIVTTNSATMAKRLRLLRAHGITRDPWRRAQTRTLGHYDVVEPGWKANLADLQAAAALPKIARIDELRAHRADLVERYDAGLAPLRGITPIGRPGYGVHAHHLYVVRIDPAVAGADRDAYAAALMAENVATGLHFLPVHMLTWYRENLDPRAAAGDRASRRGGAVAAAGRGPLGGRRRGRARRRAQGARGLRGRGAMSRRTRVVLEALVSGVLLAAILHWAGIHRVLHELSRTQLRWFLPAVAVSIATVPVMALRWRLLLSAKGIDAPLAWLTRTYFVALFAGQFLPAAIGGDAVRAVELGRRTHDAPEAVASVLIDRLVGLVSLVALAVAAVAVGGGSARRPGVIAAEAAFGVAAAGTLALLFSSRLRGVVARVLEPRSDGHRLAAGGRFYEALHTYRGHRRTLALVGTLALVVQLARVGVIWLLTRALSLDVPDSVILLTGPVVFASLALPVSLNGIGVREGVLSTSCTATRPARRRWRSASPSTRSARSRLSAARRCSGPVHPARDGGRAAPNP